MTGGLRGHGDADAKEKDKSINHPWDDPRKEGHSLLPLLLQPQAALVGSLMDSHTFLTKATSPAFSPHHLFVSTLAMWVFFILRAIAWLQGMLLEEDNSTWDVCFIWGSSVFKCLPKWIHAICLEICFTFPLLLPIILDKRRPLFSAI